MNLGRRWPTLLVTLLGTALLAAGALPYVAALADRGEFTGRVAVTGTPYVVPDGARRCALTNEQSAARRLEAQIIAFCLSDGAGGVALQRWATEHMPGGRPYAGLPWCDRQVLADGSRLYRWGRETTSGYLRSDPRDPGAWLVIVTSASPCG